MARIKHHPQAAPRSGRLTPALAIIGLTSLCFSLHAQAASDDTTEMMDADGVVPPTVDFTSCRKPMYPQSSMDKQEHGTVHLAFDIDAAGHIRSARIEASSGSPDLDREALGAIAKCDFKPATRAGTPVASTGHVEYLWTLD
jgi:D-alanyl-D-alanine endopeptidase (penicillin-binding protein 7)